MRITFWGAARQVTGSMYLLSLEDGFNILVDCGADFEERRTASSEHEGMFPVDPSDIDLVLLTHAHLDHSGNIPNLIHAGYSGQILCTTPTFNLTRLLLSDAALLNSKKLQRKYNRAKYDSGRSATERLFLEGEVEASMDRFVSIAFSKRFQIREDLFVTFIPTGHLLGAANLFIEVKEKDTWKKIGFSGDIGRSNYPLLPDPHPMPQVDYLICETTYGNRLHTDKGNPEELVARVIKETCVNKSGRLVIPAFSIGRTQSLLYTLHKLFLKGELPPIKIFTDSPMAAEGTQIYDQHAAYMNDEAQRMYKEHGSLFNFDNLIYVRNFKESKAISDYYEPCVIISSSGMITGGRMMLHVKKNLNNAYCTFLIVGYAAEGTPGYDLRQGGNVLRIKGKTIPIQAKIEITDLYSGHADQKGLLDFVKQQSADSLKKVFLTHGEEESMEVFQKLLISEGYREVGMPRKGEYIEI